MDEMKKEHEAYLATDEYAKWRKEYDAREDDDEVRHDKDPEGWDLYLGAAENKEEVGSKFTRQVAAGNPKAAELQAKCLSFFIARDSANLALQAATNLATECASHPKTAAALKKFTEYMKTAKFDEEKLKAYKDIALPKYNKEKPADAVTKTSMTHVHELIKLDAANASLALSALNSDPSATRQVFVAENTHRRLLKAGQEALAKPYFEKAAETYPYSTYFEGSKKDLK